MNVENEIKAVVFDFGGVLLDLYQEKTFDELRKRIPAKDHDAVKELCLELELGQIGAESFIQSLRDYFSEDELSDEIRSIWNRMLGPIPKEKVDFLKELKKKYKVYLLSNTNIVHKDHFDKTWLLAFGQSMESFFDEAIFSHEVRLRKPEKDIFKYLLKVVNLPCENILFIDDLKENTDAASSLGIQTHTFVKNSNFDSINYLISSH